MSTYFRQGEYYPICYESDVTDTMVENYGLTHPTSKTIVPITGLKQDDTILIGKVISVIDGDTLHYINKQRAGYIE